MKTLNYPFIILSSFALASMGIFFISLILTNHAPEDFLFNTKVGSLTLSIAFGIEALMFSKWFKR